MNISIKDILDADDVEELKQLGSYFELKIFFERNLDFKLGVNGWESFFSKIKFLKFSVPENQEVISSLCEEKSFQSSKRKATELLGIKVKANSWSTFKMRLANLVKIFCQDSFDPYKRFEETKLKNFKNSSKLEGLDIDIYNNSTSLESVLAKYRR